jgi:hypothetical protein
MRFRQLTIIITMLFLHGSVQSQDVTGLWKGTLYNDTTKMTYWYEIAISEEKGKLTGYSHTWFILDDKQYFGIKKLKVKRVDDKIITEDAGLISNNYPVSPAKGVKQLNVLVLNAEDSIMSLTGPFTTNRTRVYTPLTGSIRLERRNDFWQSSLIPHMQELGLAKNLSFIPQEEIVRNTSQATIVRVKNKADGETAAPQKNGEQEIKKTETSLEENVTETQQIKNNEPIVAKTGAPKVAINAEVKEKTVITNNNMEKKKEENENVLQNKNSKALEIPATPVNSVAMISPKQVTTAAENVLHRNTVIQQTVFFSSDSLLLSLYDNGEVDGDTVSVLMNGKIIIANQGLSSNAFRKNIYVDKNTDSVELIMYAENLGTIAPNTGLLVVRDGKELHEFRFTGDYQKNAAIKFKRKK